MTTKRDTNWQYTGDVNPQGHGGKWFRRTTGRQYQVIELTNMDDACGRDNEGRPTYVVELSLVDLDAIGTEQQAQALRSCGPDDGEELPDAWLAVVCYEYGCKAPLESWEGNGSTRMLRDARRAAHALKLDSAELEERMERSVNRIGSTAREYMTGDLDSAMWRGVSNADPNAELMAKLGMGNKR